MVRSTTGPFAVYGSLLVELCARHGTDYCDITGETDWVRAMIDQHDGAARASGARIVHFCGHDCVPWDLSVQVAGVGGVCDAPCRCAPLPLMHPLTHPRPHNPNTHTRRSARGSCSSAASPSPR